MNLNVTVIDQLFQGYRYSLIFGADETPRTYLKRIGLDWNRIEIGYAEYLEGDNLLFSGTKEDEGFPFLGLNSIARPLSLDKIVHMELGAIVFPLRNEEGKICNLYLQKIESKSNRGIYLNKKGLYPYYPHILTKRLFLITDIINAASFIISGILDNREAVLALHNGKRLIQHDAAIESLSQLEEIIYIK